MKMMVMIVMMVMVTMVTMTFEAYPFSSPPRLGPRAGGWASAVPPPGWLLCVDAGHAAACAKAQGQVGISAAEPAGGPPGTQRWGGWGRGPGVVPVGGWVAGRGGSAQRRGGDCPSDPKALPSGTLCSMGMVQQLVALIRTEHSPFHEHVLGALCRCAGSLRECGLAWAPPPPRMAIMGSGLPARGGGSSFLKPLPSLATQYKQINI